MGHVAPIGSDIANIMFETCTDALDTGIVVFSKSDHILAASRNAGNFFPVSDEFLKQGTSLRAFLIALFEVGAARSSSSSFSRPDLSRDKWVSERIAAMWHERGEHETRVGRDRVLSLTTRRLASGLGILMARDVSAHRKMEDRWRGDLERVAMTEEILDNLPSMLFVLDRNLNYVAVNKAYSRFHGVPPEGLLDRRLVDVVDPDQAKRHEAELRDVLTTGKAFSGREYADHDGEQVLLLSQSFRLGNPGNYFVVTLKQQISDVGEGSHHAQDTVAHHPDPREADRLFDEVETTPEPASTGASAVILLSSDQRFGAALNEALHAFRFDACHASSLEETRDIVQAAHEAGLAVDLIMVDEADAELSALAPLGIRLLPLSRTRPVHFAVAEAAAAATHRLRSVSVEIDPDYLPEFPEPGRIPEPSGYDVDLLVVEDNPVNQEVYAQILGNLGISYELARDGAEALRLWDILRPSLILMDLELPDMSGVDVALRIRDAESGDAARATIVGVMPKASQEKHDRCLASGMDETILKPLSVETLEALYKRHMLVLLDRHEEMVAS
ncbi:response regulator [Rhizobium sp. C4]|uniref:response regulator n=1 Tax=Rhizobium sp. C4 TaxID=1349800 RepID=UPI001E39D077|nr:response regulator [Rhizobium sp. C4]MCD2172887.1 response regulator [Rhizobium sp. C4]